jgi:hypothetical protein
MDKKWIFVGMRYVPNHVLEYANLHGSNQLQNMYAKWIDPSRVPLPMVMLEAPRWVLIIIFNLMTSRLRRK